MRVVDTRRIYGDIVAPSDLAIDRGKRVEQRIASYIADDRMLSSEDISLVRDDNHARLMVGDNIIVRWDNSVRFYISIMTDGVEHEYENGITLYSTVASYVVRLLKRELAVA